MGLCSRCGIQITGSVQHLSSRTHQCDRSSSKILSNAGFCDFIITILYSCKILFRCKWNLHILIILMWVKIGEISMNTDNFNSCYSVAFWIHLCWAVIIDKVFADLMISLCPLFCYVRSFSGCIPTDPEIVEVGQYPMW